jgi:hypothetical protein
MGFGQFFEGLAHEFDMHICSFFLYLLICVSDLFVYVTQLHECANVSLLCSEVVNFFWPVSFTSVKTGASLRLQEKLICSCDVTNVWILALTATRYTATTNSRRGTEEILC